MNKILLTLSLLAVVGLYMPVATAQESKLPAGKYSESVEKAVVEENTDLLFDAMMAEDNLRFGGADFEMFIQDMAKAYPEYLPALMQSIRGLGFSEEIQRSILATMQQALNAATSGRLEDEAFMAKVMDASVRLQNENEDLLSSIEDPENVTVEPEAGSPIVQPISVNTNIPVPNNNQLSPNQ